MVAGQHETACQELLGGAAELHAAGRVRGAQTMEARAARELLGAGRLPEATAMIERLLAEGIGADPHIQIVTESVRARIASTAGAHERALDAADQARQLAEYTDDPCLQGDILFDCARVLRSAGQDDRSAATAAAAAERYLAKGASALADQVRIWAARGGGE